MIVSKRFQTFVVAGQVAAMVAVVILGHGVHVARADFDVRPYALGGQIVTDGYSDGTFATQTNDRVFGYAFGDITDPFFTEDPGFNAVVGSGLQAGPFTFQVLGPANGSVIPYSLSYWDGSGSVAWTSVPSGESLNWNVGSKNVFINSTGSYSDLAQTIPSSGYSIGDVAAGGNIHIHLSAFLLGSDGNSVPTGAGDWGPGDGTEASSGVYAVSIVLKNGSLANSDPIWIVYNKTGDDAAGGMAMDWLNAHAVPEPAGVSLGLGAGAVGMVVLWRKNRGKRRG